MFSLSVLFFICLLCSLFFFFNDTATTEIYTLSLHDALPILRRQVLAAHDVEQAREVVAAECFLDQDRKSTRLNSSHGYISYAVFCLKKKKKKKQNKDETTNKHTNNRSMHTHDRSTVHDEIEI